MRGQTPLERFHQQYTVDDKTGCLLWNKPQKPKGYGAFWWNGKGVKAHKASYILFVGPIKTGDFVCHSCDTPNCVNPSHLWLGDNSKNMLDAYRKGRPVGNPWGRKGKPK